MRHRKIKTPFGYVPISLNFYCFQIYATSHWLLTQISRRELERKHNVVIRSESLHQFISSMAYEFTFLCDYYEILH